MDLQRAKQILVVCAKDRRENADPDWLREISALHAFIEEIGESRTILAALGTAILAKSTDPDLWAFSLKSDAGFRDRRGYSARNLAKEVLAANQSDLSYHLGVGREPLNNQPFYSKPAITKAMAKNAKKKAQPAFEHLLRLLKKLEDTVDEAMFPKAMCAFLQVCKAKPRPRISQTFSPGPIAVWRDMAACVRDYCEEDAEGGRRAQAVAAGLCDLIAGRANVAVDRVNSPSRHAPGDIHLRDENKKIHLAIEVRAKPVTVQDIYDFIEAVEKTPAHAIKKACILGVSADQCVFTDGCYSDIGLRAQALGIHVRVYIGWEDFFEDIVFWSARPSDLQLATSLVLDRLVEIDVSNRGVQAWRLACRKLLM